MLHDPSPIATYLERQGITQKEFAELVGVSQSIVSQWLSGERGIAIHTAHRLQKRTKREITVRALFPKLFEAG